jgi:hypothetical protein
VPDRALPGQQINNTVGGAITIEDATGAIVANQVIAVIFAPGQALPGKDRTTVGKTNCGGNNESTNYLDIAQGVDNSKGGAAGNTFIAGTPSATFNDKLVYITAQDLYQAVSKRIVRELLGNVMGNAGPVDYYLNNANTYPCPSATVTGVQDCALPSGVINNATTGMNLQYPALGAWLSNNNWFANEAYTYFAPSRVKVTVAYPGGSYSCDANPANANIYTCSSP